MSRTLLVCLFGAFLLVFGLLLPTRAQAVDVQLSTSTINFGSVNVNSSSSVVTVTMTNPNSRWATITNIASNSPEFIVGVKLPVSMSPHSSATFTVVFRPTAAQSYSGTITISDFRNEAPEHISVSGTGISSRAATQSLLSLSASSLAFGSLGLGSSSTHSVSFTNTGRGSITISGVAVSGAGFTVNGFSTPANVAAGQSLTLSVKFAPVQAVNYSGRLTVTSNASSSPSTIALSGAGVQSQIAVTPASVSFGGVTAGTSNTQALTITNHGGANLIITHVSESGSGFTYSGLSLPLTIAPGGSAPFTVAFSPTTAGSFSGSLTLANNSAAPSLGIALSGTGITSSLQLSVSPASLSFGNVTTGSSAANTLTLTNTGNANVTLSSHSVSGTGFSVSGLALPLTLSPKQSASFAVDFAPRSAGNVTGSVTIASNAKNSPVKVALSGSSVARATYSVLLNWAASSSSYSGFNLYRSSVSGGPYTKVHSSLILSPSYSDTNVTNGQTYYYVATEVDSSGKESGYSSQISVTIP